MEIFSKWKSQFKMTCKLTDASPSKWKKHPKNAFPNTGNLVHLNHYLIKNNHIDKLRNQYKKQKGKTNKQKNI